MISFKKLLKYYNLSEYPLLFDANYIKSAYSQKKLPEFRVAFFAIFENT